MGQASSRSAHWEDEQPACDLDTARQWPQRRRYSESHSTIVLAKSTTLSDHESCYSRSRSLSCPSFIPSRVPSHAFPSDLPPDCLDDVVYKWLEQQRPKVVYSESEAITALRSLRNERRSGPLHQKRLYRWQRSKGEATSPYEPLDPKKREIRLLYPEPGTGSDQLVGSLEVCSLDDELVYVNTSYVWGNEPNFSTMQIDGFDLPIHRNLDDFLRRYRESGEFWMLWTDAICINQKDLTEKSHQIPLMGDLYRQCNLCNIWMGRSTAYTRKAIELMKALCFEKPLLETPAFESPKDENTLNRLRAGERVEGWYGFRSGNDSSMVFARPIPDLAEVVQEWAGNPYWSRVWTLQEFVLSRNKRLLWSDDYFDDDNSHPISGAYQITFPTPTSPYTIDDAFSIQQKCDVLMNMVDIHQDLGRFKEVWNLPLNLRTHTWDAICGLFSMTIRRCTNLRDHIYGLSGLINIPGLQVDYGLPTDVIYAQAGRRIIEHTESLYLLSLACVRRGQVHVPSWTPDWSAESNPDLFGTLCSFHWYDAASLTTDGMNFRFISERTIGVRGFQLGTIVSVFPGIHWPPAAPDTWSYRREKVASLAMWLADLEHFVGVSPDEEETIEGFLSSEIDEGLKWEDCSVVDTSESIGDENELEDCSSTDTAKAYDEPMTESKDSKYALVESLLFRDIAWPITDTAEARRRNKPEERGIYECWRQELLRTVNRLQTRERAQTNWNRRTQAAAENAQDDFFKSDLGFMGAANVRPQPGDELWIMPGSQLPFVIRPSSVSAEGVQHRILISTAYIHGFMDGEILDQHEETGPELQWCILE